MKAEIKLDGKIQIMPEGTTEEFALLSWMKNTDTEMKITDALDLSCVTPHLADFCSRGVKVEVTAAPPHVKAAAEEVAATPQPEAPDDRDAVKAELDAMGITYNSKCATKTLTKLLKDEKEKAAAVPEVPAEMPAPTPAPVAPAMPEPTPAPAPTTAPAMLDLEAVVTVARGYAALFNDGAGILKVQEIVKTFGANKISEISADNWVSLVEAFKTASAARKAEMQGAGVMG